MVKASLVLLDNKKVEDQLYSYETLKFRWSKTDLIHIKYKAPKALPTFDEHVKAINSGMYKAIYKIMLGEFPVGQIHLDKNNFTGTFYLPPLFKKALKYFKSKNIKIDPLDLTPKLFYDLAKLHPDVEVFYASANPHNTLSVNALLKYGYEQIETIFAMKVNNILPVYPNSNNIEVYNRHKQNE